MFDEKLTSHEQNIRKQYYKNAQETQIHFIKKHDTHFLYYRPVLIIYLYIRNDIFCKKNIFLGRSNNFEW